MKCSNANKLYRSSSNVYNHEDAIRKKGSSETEVKNAIKKFHEQFPVKQSVYIHVLELYRQQKGRCAISGLIMKLREEPDGNWYQVSIDAISPKKLHVKDNLQLVCRFLNCTNMEKSKSKYDANDTSGGWTTQSLYRYIGYSDN
ncbi:hypothetical protein FRACYDRAFT_226327 [Fragilariopsis cylindrus CCMP1102]|uniref:Uncharacterized protein n=1 Tax=Fragilariopsis cylindrus CCMP1102 TaxID=635003 RepID=A0A1E7FC56_9STRA|nr:hypothetical protein FRACYDRAFT_226327 [Fragilariopsis cylindrus CCMP1102]|eukprot:OEU15768.1 hypothetical protein FRACYDRAFT_226327 [Fragilariopsis cylindrus CCMP1102]